MRYGIDINENAVRVIKYATNGLIRKLGECEFYSPHPISSDEYIVDLVGAIKYAAADAGMGRGSSCTVVAGGPEVIIRKFTWPEMPDAALAENAQNEFSPFLPGDADEFVMSYEVIKREKNEESGVINIDVLVAALPTELVNAINKAVSKAGFKVQRIDVRENARMKLVANCCIAEDNAAPTSYAVLDFSQARANVGLYLDGVFYSSRYFVATIYDEEPEEELEPEQEYDEYGQPIPMEEAPPKRPPVGKYDPAILANDVVSIIDYMQYRERGSSISCILLIGEENLPGIIESLEDSLDIPVFRAMDWLYSGIDNYVTGTYGEFILAPYLDAYATSFPSLNPKNPINLKGKVEAGKAKKMIIPFAVAGIGTVALMLAAVIYFTPRIRDLEVQIAEVRTAVEQFDEGDHADLALATREADILRGQMDIVDEFFTQYIQLREAIPIFMDPTIGGNLQRPIGIASFNFSEGEGTLVGHGNSFIHVADATDYMLTNELIYSATVVTVTDTPRPEDGDSVDVPINMSIVLEEGVGVRHGFIND